ncbi:thioredoxin family protein [Paraburkholderia tropica]|uniref:thioredoxin family protein n=1 Tax=Paraburkholderia tropica TaxID=92647 RepID=UPI002AB7EEFA|nr:thioredoxin family protein [Paraburkholderia tropica]
MSITDTTESTFDADINVAQPIVLDFWAPWCGPCKALMPHLEAISEKAGEALKVLKINIDESPKLAQRFGVRGIPTLVFVKEGMEEGRLVGTTTSRLNVVLEKWVGLRGLRSSVSGEPVPAVAAAVTWSSFAGRQDLKDAAVERIRAIADERSASPSKQMAETGALLEAELSIPASLFTFINYIWDLNYAFSFRSYPELRELIVELVSAIPVGKNLQSMPRQFHYDILYRSEWAIAQYFDDHDVLDFLGKLRSAHERELQGVVVPESEWDSLRDEAILLADMDGDRSRISRAMEALARPISRLEGSTVSVAIGRAHDDERREPYWSPQDVARTEAVYSKLGKVVQDELGVRPTSAGSELHAWYEKGKVIRDTWLARQREEDPEFWARHALYEQNVLDTRKKMADYLSAQLQARLAAVHT